MTVFCSNLPSDQDLIKALGSFATPRSIPYGDLVFWGVGDGDVPLRICIERKKIGDMAQCINGGRYLHQAQSAADAGFDVLCLIVEGELHPNPDDGLLEVPVWGINPRTMRRAEIWQPVKPTLLYSRFDQYLTELDYIAGVVVKRSRDVCETAVIIKALYVNFQTAPSDHGSLRQIYKQPQSVVLLRKPNLLRRVAVELDGVGWKRSEAVARHFRSVREMVNANVDEWRKIEGVGKKTAERIVASLDGQDIEGLDK